jgi:DNA-binding MarR family transcriptional regulator
MSLKNSILYLIKSQGEVSINELEDLCREENYKISNYERRARELSNAGLIEPIKKRTKDGTLFINGYKAI